MATRPSPLNKPAMPDAKNPVQPSSFWRDSFPFIRKASIVFGICAGISLTLAGGTEYLKRIHTNGRNQARIQKAQADDLYRQAGLEKEEVHEFQPKFLQLRARGFVGDERRLDWLDYLRDSQEKRRLFPLTYDIAPQQPLMVDPSVPVGSLELRASKMTLRMKLWQEMDLFNLLDDLREQGFYAPAECTMARSNTSNSSAYINLDAECKLYWLTLAPPAAPAEAGDKPAAQPAVQ